MKFLILLSLAGAASANASLLLTDSFDYPESSPLAGSGPWSSTSQGVPLVVARGSLRAPAEHPPSGGNRVFFPAQSIHQSVSRPIADIEAGTVYVSVLIRVDGIGRHAGVKPKTHGSLLRLESRAGAAGTGLFLQTGDKPGTFQLAVHKRANGQAISAERSSPDLEIGKVHHVVFSYFADAAGEDSCALWVNPVPAIEAPARAATPGERSRQRTGGSPEAEAPDPIVTSVSGRDLPDAVWSSVVLDPPNGGSSGFYDELRVATSWADLWR